MSAAWKQDARGCQLCGKSWSSNKISGKEGKNEELNWNLIQWILFYIDYFIHPSIISSLFLLNKDQFHLKNHSFCLQNQVDLKVELLVKRPHEILLLKIEIQNLSSKR